MKFHLGITMLVAALAGSSQAAELFHDTFTNASDLAYYGVDRSPGQTFALENAYGRDAVKLTVWHNSSVTDPFYNFQGYQRYLDTAHTADFNLTPGAGQYAYLKADLYVPSSWDGNDKRGGDLWARIDDTTQTIGFDFYPTLGVYNYGDGNGALVSIFEGTTGNIIDLDDAALSGLGTSLLLDAWNQMEIRFAPGKIDFLFNGSLIHTDTGASLVNAISLDAAFLQGWRPSSFIGSSNTYDIHFDNVRAGLVPEPASMTALALGAAALLRRRAKK